MGQSGKDWETGMRECERNERTGKINEGKSGEHNNYMLKGKLIC